MAHLDEWVVRANITTGAGITLLQIQANANAGFELIGASLSQRGNTVSEQDDVAIVRKIVSATVSAAVSGGASGNLFPVDPNQTFPPTDTSGPQVGTNATGFKATAEGVDGDIPVREGFNILNGWLYVPVPEERIWVPPNGIIAMKLIAAPGSSNNWFASMKIREE